MASGSRDPPRAGTNNRGHVRALPSLRQIQPVGQRAVVRIGDVEYRKDQRGFFPSIHGTLNHVLVGDCICLSESAPPAGPHPLRRLGRASTHTRRRGRADLCHHCQLDRGPDRGLVRIRKQRRQDASRAACLDSRPRLQSPDPPPRTSPRHAEPEGLGTAVAGPRPIDQGGGLGSGLNKA